MAAADDGRLPLCCPVPGCRERWPSDEVAWALNPDELARYNAAVRSVREMRQAKSKRGSTSPRTAEAMRNLGVRACPQCGAGIQKQSAGMGHGCDKMTCRCGCKFCFCCGTPAGPNGAPRCQCVEGHHTYLDHEEVLRNYSGNPFDAFAGASQQFFNGFTNSAGPAQGGQAFFQQFANNAGSAQTQAQVTNLVMEGIGQAAQMAGQAFANLSADPRGPVPGPFGFPGTTGFPRGPQQNQRGPFGPSPFGP